MSCKKDERRNVEKRSKALADLVLKLFHLLNDDEMQAKWKLWL
jgi:hypothetical protein